MLANVMQVIDEKYQKRYLLFVPCEMYAVDQDFFYQNYDRPNSVKFVLGGKYISHNPKCTYFYLNLSLQSRIAFVRGLT